MGKGCLQKGTKAGILHPIHSESSEKMIIFTTLPESLATKLFPRFGEELQGPFSCPRDRQAF
jgi:hypothetical protein